VKLGIERLSINKHVKDDLEKHLVLAFTGKTRLAKNILQTVLHRWLMLEPYIRDAVSELYQGAHEARDAILRGDLDGLGKCLSENWERKKTMTGADSGAEPPIVGKVISALRLRNAIRGASLCGAGGGGFMAVLTSDNVATKDLASILSEELSESDRNDASGLSWHECKLCDEGLSIRLLQDDLCQRPMEDFDIVWHRPGHN